MNAKSKTTASCGSNVKQKCSNNCSLCGVQLESRKLYYEHCWSLMHHIRCAEHEKGYQHYCIICKKLFNTLTAYGEHLPSNCHKDARKKFLQAIDKGKSIQQLIKAKIILSPKIPRSSTEPEEPKVPEKKVTAPPSMIQRNDPCESRQHFYDNDESNYGWNFNQYQQQPNYNSGNYQNYPINQFPSGPYSFYRYCPPPVPDWYNQGNKGNNRDQQSNGNQRHWQAPNYYGNNAFGANRHFSTRWPYNSWHNNQYYCPPNNIPYSSAGSYQAKQADNERKFENYQDCSNYEKSQHIRFEEKDSSFKEKQNKATSEQTHRKSNCSPHDSAGKRTPPSRISSFEIEKQPIAARLSPADFTFALPESHGANKINSENGLSPRTSQSPSAVSRKSPLASDNTNEEISPQLTNVSQVFESPKVPQQQNIEINPENARNLVNLACSRKDKLLLDKLLHEYDRVTIKAAMNRMGSNLISLVDKDAAEDVIASLSALGLVNPGSTLDDRPPSRIPDNLMGKIEELFQLSINSAQEKNKHNESGNYNTTDQNQGPPFASSLEPLNNLEESQNKGMFQQHANWIGEMAQILPHFEVPPAKPSKVKKPKNAKKQKANIRSSTPPISEALHLDSGNGSDTGTPVTKAKKRLIAEKKSKKACSKLAIKKTKKKPLENPLQLLTVSNVPEEEAAKIDIYNAPIESEMEQSIIKDETKLCENNGKKKKNAEKSSPKKKNSKKCLERKSRTPDKPDYYPECSSTVDTTTIAEPLPEIGGDVPISPSIHPNIPIMNIKMEVEENQVEVSPPVTMVNIMDDVHIKQEVVEENVDEELAIPNIDSTTPANEHTVPTESSVEAASGNSSEITLQALNFAIEEEKLQREIHIIKNQISEMRAVQLKLEKRRKFVRKEWEVLMKSLMKTQDGRTLASSLKRIISEIPSDPVQAQTLVEPNDGQHGPKASSSIPELERTPVINLASSNSSESSNASNQPIKLKNCKRKKPEKVLKKKSKKDRKKSPAKKLKTNEDQPEVKVEEKSLSVLPVPPKMLPIIGEQSTMKVKKTLAFSGHVDKVGFMKVHKNLLYSSSNDGTIRQFRTKLKDNITEMKCISTFTHCSDKIIAMEMVAGKEESFIITSTSDGVLKKFDINSGKCLITLDTKSNITCIVHRWGSLFVCMEDGTIARHYLSTLRIVDSFPCSSWPITCLATTNEGAYRILCIGSEDKSVTLKEANSGLFIRSFELEYEYPIKIEVLKGISYTLGCHNQQSKSIYLHNLLNGDFLQELRNTSNVTCLRVIDQHLILVGGKQGVIRLIDSQSQKMKQVYYGGGHKTVTSLILHRNLLISGNGEGKIEACEMIIDQTFVCNFGKCPGRFAFYEDAIHHIKQTHSSSSQIKCLASNCEYIFQKDEEDKLKHILTHVEFVQDK